MEGSESFFREGSPFFKHPLLTEERTAVEVTLLEKAFGLAPGERVLDVGCGFGRHSIELARRGYEVTGIDPSEAMIEAARQGAEAAGVAANFRQARGQDFTSLVEFDAAICLFTTLGQVDDAGDNSALVPHVHSLLKPGGWFAVEVPQRETAVRQLQAQDRFGAGDVYTEVRRCYDPSTQILNEEFRVVNLSSVKTYTLQVRLYSHGALFNLLESSGFKVQMSLGDYSGRPLSPEHGQMILIARREE